MKEFFPESLGQKHECTLGMGVYYTQQNTVLYEEPSGLLYNISVEGCTSHRFVHFISLLS